jgi:hypothetical protein
MSARTPLITVPLSALKVGMQVKDHNGDIGHIASIGNSPLGERYPIKVQIKNGYVQSYTPEGFLIHSDDAEPKQMRMGITLVEPISTNDNSDTMEEIDTLTKEELDNILDWLNKTLGMSKLEALRYLLK